MLCVAAAIVILVVGIYALRPREPSYQGKSLSDWVDLLYSTNHTQAMNSIGAIGPKAIPFLLDIRETSRLCREDSQSLTAPGVA